MNTKIRIKSKYSKTPEIVELEFAQYQDRNKIAIIALQEGELYDYLTCNGAGYYGEDVVSFRSDYPEYPIALFEAGIIEEELLTSEPSGYIFINYYKLTEEAFKEISKKNDGNN